MEAYNKRIANQIIEDADNYLQGYVNNLRAALSQIDYWMASCRANNMRCPDYRYATDRFNNPIANIDQEVGPFINMLNVDEIFDAQRSIQAIRLCLEQGREMEDNLQAAHEAIEIWFTWIEINKPKSEYNAPKAISKTAGSIRQLH